MRRRLLFGLASAASLSAALPSALDLSSPAPPVPEGCDLLTPRTVVTDWCIEQSIQLLNNQRGPIEVAYAVFGLPSQREGFVASAQVKGAQQPQYIATAKYLNMSVLDEQRVVYQVIVPDSIENGFAAGHIVLCDRDGNPVTVTSMVEKVWHSRGVTRTYQITIAL